MPRHIVRASRTGAVAAAVLLLATGCAAGGAAGGGSDELGPLPDGVSVQLVQLRSDVAARQAQVQVRNDTDADLTVGALAVLDPGFAGPASRVRDRDSLVRAGGTVDIRIQLPAVACGASGVGESTLQLTYSIGDTSARAEAPVDDPLDFLEPLHERECRAEAVADAAALGFASFTPSAAGEPAALVLGIAPTGEGAVTVVGIQTTNLLTFAGAAGSTADTFPLGVSVERGDADPVDIRIPLVPLRCDPHAVQEDKRGTIFTVEVELDGESGQIELAAPEEMRGRMLTWVADWCGFGSG